MKHGQLRVWWIPQVPMEPFHVEVVSLTEAALLLTTLAGYDAFQFKNNVKPDYCNAGGVEVRVKLDASVDVYEWIDWLDDEGNELLEGRTLSEIRKHEPIWEMAEILKPL